MLENFTHAYMPEDEQEYEEGKSRAEINVMSPDMKIHNYFGIPSSRKLMDCKASSREEVDHYV